MTTITERLEAHAAATDASLAATRKRQADRLTELAIGQRAALSLAQRADTIPGALQVSAIRDALRNAEAILPASPRRADVWLGWVWKLLCAGDPMCEVAGYRRYLPDGLEADVDADWIQQLKEREANERAYR